MPWGTSFPTFFGGAALVRAVALRERVNVVHAHQNFSPIAHEAAHAARALGVPVVFTDHSLFGFADTAGVLTNALLRWTLAEVQAVVCVSNISKENSVLPLEESADQINLQERNQKTRRLRESCGGQFGAG